jgi:hypothetical protein
MVVKSTKTAGLCIQVRGKPLPGSENVASCLLVPLCGELASSFRRDRANLELVCVRAPESATEQ